MTRYANSKFSVGANSAGAAKAYRDNYDRIFGKKKDYLHVISDHEIDEIVEESAKKQGLRKLTQITEEAGGYDKERADAAPPRRRGRK